MDPIHELYEGCYHRLVGQVFLLTGDRGAAQDAVQEAFVKALASPSTFARVEDPEAWLRTVAFNAARGRWRRQRHLDRLLHIGQSRSHDDTHVSALTSDRVALIEAMRQLPFEQREALTLHHVVDLPVAEVAAIVHAPVGTVKARLARGRTRLAALLRDDLDTTTEAHHG